MVDPWWTRLPRPAYAPLARLWPSGQAQDGTQDGAAGGRGEDNWFEVYRATDSVIVFYEPRQCEEALSTLVIGDERAALIDSGCGIGDLRALVEAITDLPVTVVNTHTHTDHVGGNRQFDDIVMFDHERARQIARDGVPNHVMRELIAPGVVHGPLPGSVDAAAFCLPPFGVSRWLRDGDVIDLGAKLLEVVHTPGEAPDHISLLDPSDRMLFTGDLYYNGSIWTHLPGGDPWDFVSSYERLLARSPDYDWLMPSHNEPLVPARRLADAKRAFEDVLAGRVEGVVRVDEFGATVREFQFDGFSLAFAA